jgi:hypothetical protein
MFFNAEKRVNFWRPPGKGLIGALEGGGGRKSHCAGKRQNHLTVFRYHLRS